MSRVHVKDDEAIKKKEKAEWLRGSASDSMAACGSGARIPAGHCDFSFYEILAKHSGISATDTGGGVRSHNSYSSKTSC